MRQGLRFLPALVIGCSQPTPEPEPSPEGVAEWPPAPIPQPGEHQGEDDDDGESDGDGDGGDGDGGDGDSGLSFIMESDVAAVAMCDPFFQDCPEGEKCVPYASTGGEYDANKCVPVTGDGVVSDPCVYGGVVEASDDCNASSMCWDVQESMGTCTEFCSGTADDPMCPVGLSCLIAYEGSVAVCTMEGGTTGGSESTGGSETDSGGSSSESSESESEDGPPSSPDDRDAPEPPPQICPDSTDPIELYMSNDDSNSQASPILARRRIHEGLVVRPQDVRIHEFLNYYDLSYANPFADALDVGLQMRKTNIEAGEFTLLLFAQGRALHPLDRPPMNLVFSLDTSGSMKGEPLALLQDSMLALAGTLRPGDRVSVVRWDTEQGVLLAGYPVSGPDDPLLVGTIQNLEAGGGTDLHAGLHSAYALAEQYYIEGGLNRVVLISDGGANAGVTDIDLIAAAASDENAQNIYLMGVGVGSANGYEDELMDAVTDAGKGAYLFIDSPVEAEKMFGEDFISLASVAARDVRMRLTLPWYFGVKAFHGEEISSNPVEVDPQHLSPNDAMSFHQIIAACDPEAIDMSDAIEAHVDYLDPHTLEPKSDTLSVKLGDLVVNDAKQLHKADVIVGYAKALIVIGDRWAQGEHAEAVIIANDMTEWLEQAAQMLGDPEVEEMAELMAQYTLVLEP